MKKTFWEKWEKLCGWAGDFTECDGFAYLAYADSADHSICEGCEPEIFDPRSDDLDDGDPDAGKIWVAHFHPHMPACDLSTIPVRTTHKNLDPRCGEWAEPVWVCIGAPTAEEAIMRVWTQVIGREWNYDGLE